MNRHPGEGRDPDGPDVSKLGCVIRERALFEKGLGPGLRRDDESGADISQDTLTIIPSLRDLIAFAIFACTLSLSFHAKGAKGAKAIRSRRERFLGERQHRNTAVLQ